MLSHQSFAIPATLQRSYTTLPHVVPITKWDPLPPGSLAAEMLKSHLHIQLSPRYGKIRAIHTRQNPNRDKGGWTQTPILYQEAICSWYLLGKGRISLLQWSDTGSSTTLQGRSHVQELANTVLVFGVCTFILGFCFVFVLLVCFYFSSCFLFAYFLFLRERTRSWMHREVWRSEKIWATERNMIKIYSMKKI